MSNTPDLSANTYQMILEASGSVGQGTAPNPPGLAPEPDEGVVS